MLKRNIYFLYPAGYGGSYIRWAISISDKDLAVSTPTNPLNTSTSAEMGGAGTSHGHIRIPTHQLFNQHLNWVIVNKPQDYRIYLINVNGDPTSSHGTPEHAASMIFKHDPSAIVVNIHDGNDRLIAAFGNINSITKWPTFLHLELIRRNISSIDAFNCNTQEFRNYVVENPSILPRGRMLSPLAFDTMINTELTWYGERSKLQPHEVNPQTYPNLVQLAKTDCWSQIFQLTCQQAMSPAVLDLVENILRLASDNYDTTYLREFHQNYLDAQDNLQWFSSIKVWKEEGVLDDYLSDHAIVQSQVILEMFNHQRLSTHSTIRSNWKDLTLKQLNEEFQNAIS